MYKVAGCTGTLQASTRQLLKCLCPHLALYPAHAFSLSSRRAVSSTTDSSHSTVPDLPTSLSQGPVLGMVLPPHLDFIVAVTIKSPYPALHA